MVLLMALTGVQAAGYQNSHPLGLSSRLNRMVDEVDASIWEKKQHMSGRHSYPPYGNDLDEDEVTIVQTSLEEQETHPEDMQDYVNNAPWTRRRTGHSQPINTIDMQLIKLAAMNAQRVKTEGRCEVPQQRCEAIRSPHHPADTVFLPRCALLHRCAEDTGCCLSDENVCAPAETETVELFFYAFGGMRAKIEVMTFVNHTRCSCLSRNLAAAPGSTPVNCTCPRFYSPTPVDGQCACDCDPGRSKCRRYKKGRRYFSSADIKCITTGECVEPTCEYGPFLLRQRRCTKRRERERYQTSRK